MKFLLSFMRTTFLNLDTASDRRNVCIPKSASTPEKLSVHTRIAANRMGKPAALWMTPTACAIGAVSPPWFLGWQLSCWSGGPGLSIRYECECSCKERWGKGPPYPTVHTYCSFTKVHKAFNTGRFFVDPDILLSSNHIFLRVCNSSVFSHIFTVFYTFTTFVYLNLW